jgi:flagellar biosynthesis regulator FlbT
MFIIAAGKEVLNDVQVVQENDSIQSGQQIYWFIHCVEINDVMKSSQRNGLVVSPCETINWMI